MRIDAKGGLGLGLAVNAGWTTDPILQVGPFAMASRATSFAAGTDLGQLSTNQYWDGSTHKYIAVGNSSIYTQNDGGHSFSGAPVGSADGAITYVTGLTISAAGEVQKPNQPAFIVRPASQQDNIAVNANTTVVFGTEIADQGGNFASNTFTAPVTGLYQLNVTVYFFNVQEAMQYIQVNLQTSNNVNYAVISTSAYENDSSYLTIGHSVLADMDANDTAFVQIQAGPGGLASTDITINSQFSGYLVA